MIDHDTAPAPLEVRRLQPADGARVDALAARLRRWFSPRDLADIAALLRDAPSGWVAVAPEGTVVGFLLDAATDDPSTREVAWMAVEEGQQGRGTGSLLLDAAVRGALAEGIDRFDVSTVAESAGYAPYTATRAFYHRRGFVDVRVDRDYYWPGGDRLLLRRVLRPTPEMETKPDRSPSTMAADGPDGGPPQTPDAPPGNRPA